MISYNKIKIKGGTSEAVYRSVSEVIPRTVSSETSLSEKGEKSEGSVTGST